MSPWFTVCDTGGDESPEKEQCWPNCGRIQGPDKGQPDDSP